MRPKKRKYLNKKSRFDPQENVFKTYFRKRTIEEVQAYAEQCRTDHLNNPTDGEQACQEILDQLAINYIPEYIIWYANGFKFIMVDIFLPDHGIAIEIDGQTHAYKKPADRERDNWLASQGIYCVRFQNRQVTDKPEKIIAELKQLIDK